MKRHHTKEIAIGQIRIGGRNPVAVQSMTNTDTRDTKSTIAQIKKLAAAGCEIVRVAVPDETAAKAIGKIKAKISIPLVADIHFNYNLALTALANGVDKIRLNPGNIGSAKNTGAVVAACKERNVPIRIGVNIGSLEKKIETRYGRTAQAMVESALYHIGILEKLNFHNIVISLKASDVPRTIEAYAMLAKAVDYPLHIGITEAGTPKSGIIKSAVGLGTLLYQGIGDTIRVSLTADPVEEVRVAWEILKALNLRQHGVNLISCPTCGRTEIDLIGLARRVEKYLAGSHKPITVAVMGCVVNGPGEAKEADIGLAGGRNRATIFKRGRAIKTVPAELAFDELIKEINRL
ncbi:MAG: flavodoxin-dependent (E)-4-hydroxy-3-methylbut-2-enyl-diphosphate synthase [Patescibacteria group bacterium]